MDKKKETELQRFIREMFVENVGLHLFLFHVGMAILVLGFNIEQLLDWRFIGVGALFTFGGYIANTK